MRQLLALVILGITVYGIVDCAQSDARTRRNIPLWVWVALMIVLPGLGAVIWLILSRLVAPPPAAPRHRPLAPDDDPDFLRELERRSRQTPSPPEEDAPVEDEPTDGGPTPPDTDTDTGSDRPAGERG